MIKNIVDKIIKIYFSHTNHIEIYVLYFLGIFNNEKNIFNYCHFISQ